MEIVIKIPNFEWLENEEDLKTAVKEYEQGTRFDKEIRNALINGIPLPEHHGRLIDADELYGDFIDGTEGYDCNTWNRIEIGDIIEDAPTILEGE